MDDPVAKPPVKPTKAARAVAKRAASPSLPQPVPPKPTGKTPAPAAKPAPIPAAPLAASVTEIAAVAPPLPQPPAAIAPTPIAPPVGADPVAATASPAPALPVDAPAPAPVVQPTQTAAKEVIIETIENVTAKTQTAFNDATERAKGAVEKGQKFFEDANEFGKGNIEALVESSKIAARGFEALGQDAAAFAKKSFEEATAAARTLTSVKSPTEFMKLHSDYVRSAFDGLVQQTSHNTEALLKLAGEVAQPLSNRVALAAEKMKVAA